VINNAANMIELDWRASTGAGANNGGLTLWINGVQKANITGVDNDTRRIDRIRLGAVSGVDTGTRGTYYFDAFESRRMTYIGPSEPSEPSLLHHFTVDSITGTIYAGTPFSVRITAHDQFGNIFNSYTSQAMLSDTTGTISPTTTGSFVSGVWSGNVAIGQAGTGVTITVSSGGVIGVSNAFNVLATPTTPTEIRINCWEDAHQSPVLVTTTNPGALNATDGNWTEFKYDDRPFPAVFAGVNEENYGLPVMRFYATGVPNGEYEVFANLYTGTRTLKYYFGYQESAPKANSIDVTGGGSAAYEFREVSIGKVVISNSVFNIYVRDADLLVGSYPYFGWAWIRLVSQ
jgi:hypothetical protein